MSTIKEYLEEIQGRPVAVIGMGVSNTPLIKMLLRAGAEVTVRDRVPRERAAEQVQELESLPLACCITGSPPSAPPQPAGIGRSPERSGRSRR